MKKIMFIFVLLISFFTLPSNNIVAEGATEKHNPINLSWTLLRDISGVKVYISVVPKKASDSAQAESNLWGFWYVANDSEQDIEFKISGKVYKTSAGEYKSPHSWKGVLKQGKRTESQYLSHLQMQEWVDSDPKTQFHSVDFNVVALDMKTGLPLEEAKKEGKETKTTFGNLSGKWSVIGSKDKKTNIIKIKDDGKGNLSIIEEKDGTEWGFMKFNKATGEVAKNETWEIMGKSITVNLHVTLVVSGGKITGSGTLQSIQSEKEETIKISVEKVSN